MKDHEIRELVNSLTEVAVKYSGTQQLRERISRLVVPALMGLREQAESQDRPIAAYGSLDGHWILAQDYEVRPDKERFVIRFYGTRTYTDIDEMFKDLGIVENDYDEAGGQHGWVIASLEKQKGEGE